MQKGLSWAGTRELAQLLGSIEVEADPQIEMRDEDDGKGPYWRVMCRATDKRRNVTVLGGVHEYVWKPKRDGGRYENQHAFTVALSKAQRNAIKYLIPVSIVHTLIEDMEQLADGQITVGEVRRAVDVKTGVIEEKAAPPARASASVVRGRGGDYGGGGGCRASEYGGDEESVAVLGKGGDVGSRR